ncbi:MAG: DUF7619 domain-containing protein, partial [Myxococcota bacterium]
MNDMLKQITLFTILFSASNLLADIDGNPPARIYQENKLRGSYAAIGSTLTLADQYEYGMYNFYLLSETGASFTLDFPSDAKIKKAFLFWSGSTYDYPAIVDNTATIKTPYGQTYNISTSQCTLLPLSLGNFYYCRADISDKLAGLSIKKGDSYRVGNIDAYISNNCDIDPQCQARYAGWSMIVIWESQTFPRYRDIVIYDGFYHLDETTSSAGIAPPFTLDGFVVGDPPYAELTFFGLEGDSQLGEPEQSLLPKTDPLYCITCNDFIKIKRAGGNYIYLQNDSNLPNNIWNSSHSTVEANGVGIDIDTFNIGAGGLNVLMPGDTSLIVQAGVGDGFPVHPVSGDPNAPDFNDSAAGGGESVFLGFIALGLDTIAPIFENSQKHVDKLEASAGEILTYTIDVINTGSADATNTVVTDLLPANTTYVPNSTYLDGTLVADINGNSPLFTGMNIGTVSSGVGNRRRIQFKVRINDNVAGGTYIYNRATIRCNEIPAYTTNQVSTLVKTASIGEFTKKVLSITDPYGRQKGYLEPGDSINYEVRIKSNSSFPITIDRFEDAVPKHTRVVSLLPPSGSTDESTQTSIIIRNISFEPYAARYIRYTLKVDTVNEWGNTDPINGYQIKNQGLLTGGSLDRVYLSDDPTTPAPNDPTILTVRYGSDLSSSSKSVIDINGGNPEPGDELLYTIVVRNTGTRTVSIQVEDTLSNYAEFIAVDQTIPSQIKYSISGPKLIFYNFSLATNETATIKYRVRISYSIPAGSVEFKNTARIYSIDEPNYFIDVSASLTVVSGPIISLFQKGAKINGVETRGAKPGDKVDYYIVIKNTGNGAANNVVIEDAIDSNLNVDVSTISDGGRYSQNKIIWEYLDIGVGITRTLKFSATIKIPLENNTVVKNQATLYSQDIKKIFSDDPTTSILGDSTDITVRFNPQIKNALKFVNGQKSIWAHGGDVVTFTIEFENDSYGPLRNIVLTDSVSKLLKNIEIVTPGGFVDANQTINWNIPILNYQEKKTFVFRAEVRPPTKPNTVIPNFATVIASQTYTKNTDTVNIYLYDEPNLTNTYKYASYDGDYAKRTHNANAGDTLVFGIMVKNSGPATATNVKIVDPLDARIVEVSDISDGGYRSGNEIIWNIPALNPNESRTLSFKGKIRSPLENGAKIQNQARITSDQTKEILSDDPDTPLSPDPLIITISSSPFIVLTKKARDENGADINGTVRPYSVFRFFIEAINTGNAVANDVVLTDYVDKDRYEILEIDNGGFLSGSHLVWNIPSLDTGESNRKTVSFKVKVKECVSGKIVNYAEVTSREIQTAQRSNILELPIDNIAKKGVFSKRLLSRREPVPQEKVIYELSYRTDDIPLCDAVITDIFPDELILLSATGGKISGNTFTISQKSLKDLAAITIEAKIKSPIKNGTIIRNQAYIEASNYRGRLPSDDPDTTLIDDPTEIKVKSSPDIYMIKKADVEEVAPGGTINYSILILNNGTDYAEDIVVKDDFADMSQYISDVQANEGIYDPALHTLTFNLQSLGIAPQYYKRYDFSVRLKSDIPDGTLLLNQSRLIASNSSEVLSDNNVDKSDGINKTSVKVINRPDISITKLPYRVDGRVIQLNDYVSPDEEYIYKLQITNNADIEAVNIEIEDIIDDSKLTLVAVDNSGQIDQNRVKFSYTTSTLLKSLKKGEKVEFWYKVKVKAELTSDTKITNQATLNCKNSSIIYISDDTRTQPKNDPTVVTVKRFNGPYFGSSKKEYILKSQPVKYGDRVDFLITIINSGDVASTDTRLFDEISRYGWEYVKGSTKLNGSTINDIDGRSPLESGLLISSLKYGTPSTSEGVVDTTASGGVEKNMVQVEFAAIVPKGVSVMKNGAKITYRGGEYLIPEVQIPVGERPLITKFIKEYSISLDKNGNSIADIGDNIRFYLRFKNEGYAEAKSVEITDILPTQASYLANTMKLTINGQARSLTDEVDSDEGEIITVNNQITNRFVIKNLPAQSEVLITFDAVVNVCGGFLNQAELVYDNGKVLSDYDQDPSNGIQKTFVATCELPQNYFELYKMASDINGGLIEPLDRIGFRISITSQGNSTTEDVTFMDDIPQYVQFSGNRSDIILPDGVEFNYVPPPAGRYNNGLIIIKNLKFGSGSAQGVDITFNVKVKKDAKSGDVIENKAYLYTKDNKRFESNTVRLTVGGAVGSVSIQGILFRKMDRDEKNFKYGKDILLKGYSIKAEDITSDENRLRPPPKFTAAERILTDENGKFVLLNLSPAKYRLKAYNENGYLIGTKDVDLSEGSLANVEFAIIPTGAVYSSENYLPLENILVTLTDKSGYKKEFITDKYGIYYFEFEKRSYEIGAKSPDGSFIFPSVVIPPDDSITIDEKGYVSDDFYPEILEKKRYLTKIDFSTSDSSPPRLINNNLPLDSAGSLITFYKSSNKSVTKKGELVEYSLFIKNGTGKSLRFFITDEPDNGLIIKSKEFAVASYKDNKISPLFNLKVRAEKVKSKMLFTTDTFEVPSQETRVIKYLAYATFDTNVVRLNNRATLFEDTNFVVKSAYNSILLQKDYDFENSMVFGRVFCDENNNNKFDPEEMVISSARIMLDTGFIAISDVDGLYHFPVLDSGYHMIKIDGSSLPVGMSPVVENVDIYFTNGLPAKIDFPLDCRFERKTILKNEFYKVSSDVRVMAEAEEKRGLDVVGKDLNVKGQQPDINLIKGDSQGQILKSNDKVSVLEVKDSFVSQKGELKDSAQNIINLPNVKMTESGRLLITGQILSGYKLFYKNIEIKTDSGRFRYEIPLEMGKNKIVLDLIAPDNRTASVFYEIERVPGAPFVLGYATTLVSNSDFYPDGYLPSTHITAGGFGFDGKAVIYAKHHLYNKFGFKDIDITLHFDTSKMREREYILLENRFADYMYFPTFGDSSTIIKDVNSIDKFYLRIDADRNRLLFGNFNSQIGGVEQFRYEKQLYGLSLTLDNDFERYHTSNYSRLFAGIPVDYSRHKRTILKATGGSVYFLGVSDIINGSENIRVIVRDSMTQDVISDRILARYIDYTINYTTGTLILNQPLNSYIDTPSSIKMSGNPSGVVYIIAEYDYFSLSSDENYSIGLYTKENFDRRLDIGGGIVNEFENGDTRYRLYSLGLSMRYLKFSSVKGEFAVSKYAYSDYLFSQDGGISGRALSVENRDGYSILLETRGDISDLFLKDEKIVSYRLFFRMNTPYFAGANTMINQGIRSSGLELSKDISDRLSASGNLYVHFIEPLSMSTFESMGDISIYTTQQKLRYRLNERVELLGENIYSYSDFNTTLINKQYGTDILGAGANYKLTQRINIFGSMHSVFFGDRDEFESIEDRLYLTLGGTYRVKPKLYLTLSDTLRFNMDNYTQLSARTPFSETGSIYFGERVGSFNNQFIATSILGAEEQLSNGISSYGEYQVDTMTNQLNSRAILGTKGRFAISDGLNAMINYEHTEVVSDGEMTYNYSEPNIQMDPNLQIIQNYNESQQRKGPLYGYSYTQKLSINSSLIYDYMGLNYPLGFALGDNRRDVISGSIEYVKLKNIKGSVFAEFRYDNNDEKANGEDRFQYLLRVALMWGLNRDLSLSLSGHYLNVRNLKHDVDEYRFNENSIGLALRPRDFDWVNLFLKFSNVLEERYDYLLNARYLSYSHIFSIIPVFELPYGFEIIEKLALKRSYVDDFSLLKDTSLNTLL